ncbi:unnamed protein product [Leuciscus chuanchicus]
MRHCASRPVLRSRAVSPTLIDELDSETYYDSFETLDGLLHPSDRNSAASLEDADNSFDYSDDDDDDDRPSVQICTTNPNMDRFEYPCPSLNNDSDDKETSDSDPSDDIKGFAEWATQFNISHSALSALQKILRSKGLNIPMDPRTLLSTDHECQEAQTPGRSTPAQTSSTSTPCRPLQPSSVQFRPLQPSGTAVRDGMFVRVLTILEEIKDCQKSFTEVDDLELKLCESDFQKNLVSVLGNLKQNTFLRTVSKKEVETALGKWFTNARDRDGNRALRAQPNLVRRAAQSEV